MSSRPVVAIVTPLIDHVDANTQRLDSEFDAIRVYDNPTSKPDNATQVEALVTSSHDGVPEWAWSCPNLKAIGVYGVGYDGIDTNRAAKQGVWVTNTPDVLSDAVAELAVAMMVVLLRQVNAAERYARAGRWQCEGTFPLGHEVFGKRLGMLGMGSVGKQIASRADAFKMDIAYTSRSSKDVPWKYEASLQDLASWADILCCIVPGGAETDRLVGKDVLEALGPEGYLVNVGRGNVIDDDALIDSLRHRRIAGAALDVYNDEPEIREELLSMENVLLLPHIGSGTVETRTRMGFLVIDNVLAVLAGKAPLTPVNEPAKP